MSPYDFTRMFEETDCKSEQMNTLIIIDASVGAMKLKHRPQFHILGGTALIFHGLKYAVTLDIDTANKIDAEVRGAIDALISDDASNVAVLPQDYEDRLQPFMKNTLKYIDVYLLSKEDLFITKVSSGRHKDIIDILKTGLYNHCDKEILKQAIRNISEDAQGCVKCGLQELKLERARRVGKSI